MKYKLWMIVFLSGSIITELAGQPYQNTAGRMLEEENPLTIGGYGQIDYNQVVSGEEFHNGNLDVHRLILMFGYKFNDRTQFISEVELEHVKEVYVEQAFLQYEIKPWLKFRGGLMLVPMGIINEYHEPSTFNGVERPNLDKYIVPSTWREIGAGFTGVLPSVSLSYQAYVMNGFRGYDDGALLSGSDGFRKGRQKGAESMITSPSLAVKLNHFGISGLQIGLSGYYGNSQSNLYDGLSKTDEAARASADSSIVGLSMAGLDARYTFGGLSLRGQFNYGWVSNSEAYNDFTSSDLGSAVSGWYLEAAFDLFSLLESANTRLIPFIRYEQYDTHATVEESIPQDPSLDRTDLTLGVGWKLDRGAMLKMDYQLFREGGSDQGVNQFNAGVAVWF